MARQPDRDTAAILQGTLDLLVLRALQLEPMHGWGITERLEQWSEEVLVLGQGTLYPALYRLERQRPVRLREIALCARDGRHVIPLPRRV